MPRTTNNKGVIPNRFLVEPTRKRFELLPSSSQLPRAKHEPACETMTRVSVPFTEGHY
jgi:hypothetical protein